MKKRLTNLLKVSLFTLLILSAAPSAFCQFWVLSGSKADSISRIVFERYSIMPDEVPKFTHFPDKRSLSYLEQDSLKWEYKRDSVRIDFREVAPRKVRDKNVYTFLVESPESEEIELSLDSISIAQGSHLYFIGKNFYEFGGPVTSESLKKGFKRLMNTSSFESSGIYVILVEPEEYTSLGSRINVSRIYYKARSTSQPKAKIAGTSLSSDCYPHLNDQAYAVGWLSVPGRSNCSFSILNNESFDRRPLVLTARHCIKSPMSSPLPVTSNDKDAIEDAEFRVAWRYLCGSAPNESTRWISTGSTYLTSYWPTDYLLVEMEDDLPMSINYLGWDRDAVAINTPVYSLHHPGGSYNARQVYSSGFKSGNSLDDKHKVSWTVGEIEDGSSGGPLLKIGGNKVIGGASWREDPALYFKLSNAWTNGLKEYLSNINNYTSLNALIPTQITGSSVLCYDATTTYSMPNLLAGESVSWSVSAGLQILSTTGNSVTVKATSSNISATVTATFSVIKDADNPTQILTDSRSYKVWLGSPFMSVTNSTTNHTSSGYVMNMSPSSYNYLHFNHELSVVSSVNWSFPGGWSVSGTTGNDVTVWSWSGTSSFTVNATNVCGTTSAFFHPNSSGFRMAASSSTIYPNVAGDYVRISLNDSKDWEHVSSIRIIDAGTGLVRYYQDIPGTNHLKQNATMEIDLKSIAKGKYILQIQYINSKDSHHLIIE